MTARKRIVERPHQLTLTLQKYSQCRTHLLVLQSRYTQFGVNLFHSFRVAGHQKLCDGQTQIFPTNYYSPPHSIEAGTQFGVNLFHSFRVAGHQKLCDGQTQIFPTNYYSPPHSIEAGDNYRGWTLSIHCSSQGSSIQQKFPLLGHRRQFSYTTNISISTLVTEFTLLK